MIFKKLINVINLFANLTDFPYGKSIKKHIVQSSAMIISPKLKKTWMFLLSIELQDVLI